MKLKEKSNKLIQILMASLIASFYIFGENSFGSIILFIIAIMIFSAMAVEYNFKIPFKIESFHTVILLFALFCFLSAFWALRAGYAIEKGLTLIKILVCMSILYSYYSVRKNALEELFSALLWASLVVVFYSYIFYGKDLIISVILKGKRLGNSFSNVNAIGMVSGVMIIITMFKVIYNKCMWYLILDIPAVILILATSSRKALIMVFIGVFLLFIFKNLNKNIFMTVFRVISISIIAFFLIRWMMSLEAFAGIGKRMNGMIALLTGKGVIDSSSLLRYEYIKLGMDIFKRNPIFGIGMGNARLFVSSNYGYDAYLHNNYVEILADGGIVGFVIYYYIYYVVIRDLIKYFKYREKYTVVVIVLLLMQLIMDYGSVSYYYKNTIFYFLIFFICIRKMKERKRSGTVSSD
ncbi:MAG: O-antigen ligase family protein [Lachnospiraceae bacterium]|mgnify:CR=1 FL=1|jgi:putative O-antigen polymerase|nr:O-antigen ligase family protein [Lachnospiraceae bacterium]